MADLSRGLAWFWGRISRGSPVALRVYLTAYLIVWGLWITLPFLPGNLAASGAYVLLLRYAPDPVWGAISLVAGLAMGLSISREGHWRYAAFGAFLWLLFLGSLKTIAMISGTGTPGDLVLTLAALWVFFRTGAGGAKPHDL